MKRDFFYSENLNFTKVATENNKIEFIKLINLTGYSGKAEKLVLIGPDRAYLFFIISQFIRIKKCVEVSFLTVYSQLQNIMKRSIFF